MYVYLLFNVAGTLHIATLSLGIASLTQCITSHTDYNVWIQIPMLSKIPEWLHNIAFKLIVHLVLCEQEISHLVIL